MARQQKKSALSWKLKAVLALAAAMLCGRIFIDTLDSVAAQNRVDLIGTWITVAVLALGAAVWRMLLKKRKSERSPLSASDPSSPMIDDCIRNYAMEPAFKAHSKNEAIEKLVEIVAARFPQQVKNVAEVKRSVFAREKSMPTGLDNGIAVTTA